MAAYVLGDLAVRIRKTLAIPQGQCGVWSYSSKWILKRITLSQTISALHQVMQFPCDNADFIPGFIWPERLISLYSTNIQFQTLTKTVQFAYQINVGFLIKSWK